MVCITRFLAFTHWWSAGKYWWDDRHICNRRHSEVQTNRQLIYGWWEMKSNASQWKVSHKL